MYKIDWGKYISSQRGHKSSVSSAALGTRNAFDSDFGRVAFCSALRRMHDKTQVYPLTSGDFVHTRLTHSIEVMNIAMSLGDRLCRDDDFRKLYTPTDAIDLERKIPTILRTAAFVHDIGNPPFGHYGEDVIQNYFSQGKGRQYLEGISDEEKLDFTQFDGNAQGLRILTKLQYLGTLDGLNLTNTTLGAYLKYPNYCARNKDGYVGIHKHGVFYSEKKVLERIAETCHLNTSNSCIPYKRHPLSYLVEAADTICYRVMDLVDCVSIGFLDIRDIPSLTESSIFKDSISPEKTDKQNLVNLKVQLINYLVKTVYDRFIENLEDIDNNLNVDELLDGNEVDTELKKLSKKYYLNQYEIIANELHGESVINGLLDKTLNMLIDQENPRILQFMSKSMIKCCIHECSPNEPKDEDIQNFFNLTNVTKFNKLHLAVDWISGMTDQYATDIYKILSGIS